MALEAPAGVEGEASDLAPAAEAPASTDEDGSKEGIVEDREGDDPALTENAEPLGESEGGTSAYWRIAEGGLAALALIWLIGVGSWFAPAGAAVNLRGAPAGAEHVQIQTVVISEDE